MNIYPYFMGSKDRVEEQIDRWMKVTDSGVDRDKSTWIRGFGLHNERGAVEHATATSAFLSLERMRSTMAANVDSPLWWPGRICMDYEPHRRSFRWMDDVVSARDCERTTAWMTMVAMMVLDENADVDSVWWYNCMPFPQSASIRASIVPRRSAIQGHIMRGWDIRNDAHYDGEIAKRIVERRREAKSIVEAWAVENDEDHLDFIFLVDPDPTGAVYDHILGGWDDDLAIWLGDNPSIEMLHRTHQGFLNAAERAKKSVVFC